MGLAQSAAYPFTRLRTDQVWVLDAEVPDDKVRPLAEAQVTGRFISPLEQAFRADRGLICLVARSPA